jgi:sulfur-oxidizing protein SoxA
MYAQSAMTADGYIPGIFGISPCSSWIYRYRWLPALALAVSVSAIAAQPQRPVPLKSGIEFSGFNVQALQRDDFANPGMLWVTRGEKLWTEGAGAGGKSCASCHHDARTSMRGVATRYPAVDPGAARLVNLEGRINLCRTRHQDAEALAYESEDLLALTAYVAHQSRGMAIEVKIDPQNRRNFERGRDFYYRRHGQMNLSCAHCHEQNWGRRLLAETISQGHGNAYPIYRLEWQSAGSLHRRFRGCLSGVRAEMLPQGALEYLDLELFLAWRAEGLPIETPGVRR